MRRGECWRGTTSAISFPLIGPPLILLATYSGSGVEYGWDLHSMNRWNLWNGLPGGISLEHICGPHPRRRRWLR